VGSLGQAENWLKQKEGNDKYDQRWRDHRERELFNAYCAQQDWSEAKRIVESSVKEGSKQGRKKRLEELSELNYDEME